MEVKKDCFAYQSIGEKENCNALECLDCENCNFYICKEEYEARKVEIRKRVYERGI